MMYKQIAAVFLLSTFNLHCKKKKPTTTTQTTTVRPLRSDVIDLTIDTQDHNSNQEITKCRFDSATYHLAQTARVAPNTTEEHKCSTGYHVSSGNDKVKLTCNAQGINVKPSQTCEPMLQCRFDAGTYHLARDAFVDSNTTKEYKCKAGYHVSSGKDMVQLTCNAEGINEQPSKTCVKIPACLFDAGTYNLERDASVEPKKTDKHNCKPGYHVSSGNNMVQLTCNAEGIKEQPSKTCVKIPGCLFDAVTYHLEKDVLVAPNATEEQKCKPGFHVSSISELACTAQGNKKPSQKCEPKNCNHTSTWNKKECDAIIKYAEAHSVSDHGVYFTPSGKCCSTHEDFVWPQWCTDYAYFGKQGKDDLEYQIKAKHNKNFSLYFEDNGKICSRSIQFKDFADKYIPHKPDCVRMVNKSQPHNKLTCKRLGSQKGVKTWFRNKACCKFNVLTKMRIQSI